MLLLSAFAAASFLEGSGDDSTNVVPGGSVTSSVGVMDNYSHLPVTQTFSPFGEMINNDTPDETKLIGSTMDPSVLSPITSVFSKSFCSQWGHMNNVYFQLANTFFFLSYLAPNGLYGMLYLRCTLLVGCAFFALWGWAVICSFDAFLWNANFVVINFIHILVLLYRLRPIKFTQEVEEEKRSTEMNSPAKGRGLMGSKRNPKSPPQSSENPQSTANPRKRKPAKSLGRCPKQRGRYKPKTASATDDAQSPVGVGDRALAECIFSDKEEREEFLQECPKDLPTFSSPSPLSLHSLPSPSVPNERSDFGEAYVHQECSVSSVVPSLGGGINVDSEEFTSSAFYPQPWTSQSISNTLASEWSATELTETRGSPVLDEIDSVSDDDVCSPVTPTIGDCLDKEELPPSLHNGAAPPSTIIVKTVCKFSETLPPWWSTFAGKSGIHLFRYSTKTPSAIQREIFLSYGGDLNIFVHCKTLPSELDIFKSIEISNVALNIDSIDKFCSWGVSIARALEQYRTCIGADLLELKDVWGNIPNSSVDKNPYQEERYSETCSNSCSLLVSLGRPKRCGPCGKLLKSLKNRRCQLLSKEPHPSTPNIYLTYEQALQKLRIQHDDLRKKDFRINVSLRKP